MPQSPEPGGGANGLVPEGRPLDDGFYVPSVLRVTTPAFFGAMRTRPGRPRLHRRRPRVATAHV